MIPTIPRVPLMRYWFALPLLIAAVTVPNVSAQNATTVVTLDESAFQHQTQFFLNAPVVLEGEPRFSCGLTLDHEPHPGHYFRAPKPSANKSQSSSFLVNYIETGALEWTTGDGPAAKAAVERAIAQWSSTLTSSQITKVDAQFAPLATGVLGSAGSCLIHGLSGGGVPSPGPVNSNGVLFYGTPLAQKLTGTDLTSSPCDIQMTFNSTFGSWNFDIAPPGPSEWDFESVVFHELGHGLDFFGLMSYASCGGLGNEACQTIAYAPGFRSIEIWNYFIEDGSGTDLWDYTAFPDSSATLGAAVSDSAAGLFWNGSSGVAENGAAPVKIYTPDTFRPGSSFSHLDDGTFDGTMDNLMTHAIANGELARSPGPVTCGILEDQGWDLGGIAGDCPYAPLPVEMVDFLTTVDDSDILVSWTTMTEGDNAGFELEHRYGDGSFETVAFLQGQGYSREAVSYSYRLEDLATGTHSFRLRQIDVDGTGVYGPEIETVISIAGDFVLQPAYPNPFVDEATIQFAAGSTQAVRIDLYDGQGRLVRTLFDSVVDANSPYEAKINSDGLANGVYTVRMIGERTVGMQRVVLMK